MYIMQGNASNSALRTRRTNFFLGHVMGVNPTKPLLNTPLSAGYSIRATIVSQFKPIFGHAILPLLVDILVS